MGQSQGKVIVKETNSALPRSVRPIHGQKMPREHNDAYLAHFYSRGSTPKNSRGDQEHMVSDARQM